MIGFATENEKKTIHKKVMLEIEWIPSYQYYKAGIWPFLLPFLIFGMLQSYGWFIGLCIIDAEFLPWLGLFPAVIVSTIALFLALRRMIKRIKQLRVYDEIEKRRGSLRIVSYKGKYGLYHFKLGKELIAPIFDVIIRNKNFYTICDNGRWGVYNADYKKLIIPCTYDRIEYDQFLSNIKAYRGEECHLYAANGSRKS